MSSSRPLTSYPELVSTWAEDINDATLQDYDKPKNVKAFWRCEAHGHVWAVSPTNRITYGTGCPVCSNRQILIGYNDLASQRPDIAAQWHPDKNGVLTPEQVTVGASTAKAKVWWQDEHGHEWEAKVANRTKMGQGCPVCANRVIQPGFNDLATTHPHLSNEWHPNKNGALSIQQVSAGSNKVAWWLGACGHEWRVRVAERTGQKPTGCAVCAGKQIVAGSNDLASIHPTLISQWHPSKNGSLTPQQITPRSGRKIWWQCELGHEWQVSVASRTSGETLTGCPYCTGRRAITTLTDVASTHPEVAARWHPDKNTHNSTELSAGSHEKVWLTCLVGHVYQTILKDEIRSVKANLGPTCPYCAGKRIIVGDNDLATHYPQFAAEWHRTKNGSLTPQMVSVASGKRVWWQCDKGHEWEVPIAGRTGSNTGCPHCVGTSQGERDIAAYITQLLSNEKIELRSKSWGDKKQEIDIYLPSRKLGIEFNGLYWHDEAHKGRMAHHERWLAARNAGISLIQVWEDDWRLRKDRVQELIAHRLGLNTAKRYGARQTTAAVVTKLEAQQFLNRHHIQGSPNGGAYLGLRLRDNTLVALLVVKREPGSKGKVLNIVRYATGGGIVQGGFTKLLRHAITLYKPEAFITFSDHTISDGKLYEHNGFIADKEIAPDYMYVVGGIRRHKFGYRLERFKRDPNLIYEPGLTETNLAKLNRLPRIWDAGKTRWRFTV